MIRVVGATGSLGRKITTDCGTAVNVRSVAP